MSKENLFEDFRMKYGSNNTLNYLGSKAVDDGTSAAFRVDIWKNLRRVNTWLAGYEKNPAMDLNTVYQDMKVKLSMVGIIVPEVDFDFIGEDGEDEGTIEVEAYLYPGNRQERDGVTYEDDLFAAMTDGDQLILSIDWEIEDDNLITLYPQLVTQSELDSEEDEFGEDDLEDVQEDEQDDEQDDEKDDEGSVSVAADDSSLTGDQDDEE